MIIKLYFSVIFPGVYPGSLLRTFANGNNYFGRNLKILSL